MEIDLPSMKRCARGVPAAVASIMAAAVFTSQVSALEVGDDAPDFELPATDGRSYRLSDFEGDRNVVLAWFPRAFTSGCTIECKSLAKNRDKLRRYDVEFFMLSVDPLSDNQRFANELDPGFPLLSDESKEVAARYGVLYDDRFALRHTFYIDESGAITAIDSNVDPQTAAEDMLQMFDELGIEKRAE